MKLSPGVLFLLLVVASSKRRRAAGGGGGGLGKWVPEPNPDPSLNVPVIPLPPNPLEKGGS